MTKSEPMNWLVDPKRGLLLPLTGIWILALDWLLFSSNLMTAGIATPIVVGVGFVLGALGTLILQRWVAGDSLWKASLKALAAGIVVGIPWPLTGTLVGGWILLASGVKLPAPLLQIRLEPRPKKTSFSETLLANRSAGRPKRPLVQTASSAEIGGRELLPKMNLAKFSRHIDRPLLAARVQFPAIKLA